MQGFMLYLIALLQSRQSCGDIRVFLLIDLIQKWLSLHQSWPYAQVVSFAESEEI